MNDTPELLQQAREHIAFLDARVLELEALVKGDQPAAQARMQARMARQTKALDRLNRKVLTQRFRLRLLASLGRDVTRDEYCSARDAHQAKDRIGEFESVS